MSDDRAVLRTLEQRVRSLVGVRLAAIADRYGTYLATVIVANPHVSATEILSRPDVHATLTSALDAAATSVQSTIRAGYRAAVAAAAASTAAQLAALGITDTPAEPDGAFLEAIIATVVVAFAASRLDLPDSVRAAYDGVSGTAAPAARVLTVTRAIDRAVRRLGVRVNAATTVAVNRGYTDAQLAGYTQAATAHPELRLRKRWQTTSTTPCPACAALHDTAVDIDAEFDRVATADPAHRPPPVYRDLLGPPRHPNCRCRLVFEPTAASAALRTEVTRPAPVTTTRLSARQVRQMPAGQYKALSAFLRALLRRLRALLRKIRRGG